MNKIEFIKHMIDQQSIASKWLTSVPTEISHAFVDNPYVNVQTMLCDSAVTELLGKNLAEAVFWWMWDTPIMRRNNGHACVTITRPDGGTTSYMLASVQDFLDYLQTEYAQELA